MTAGEEMHVEKDIHQGHRRRVKDRFLSEGLDCFADHNVLELLLFYSVPRIDTNVLAHRLINRFGSLAKVFDAPYEELLQVDGISENSALLIKMIPSLARVYLCNQQADTLIMQTPEQLGKYFISRFVGETGEIVYLLCLDSSLNIISCELLAEGSVSSATIDIKKIVQCVVRHNAWRVVLAHNHPRGLALPSNEDVIVTREIRRALASLGIELADHIIVAGRDWYSLLSQYPNL